MKLTQLFTYRLPSESIILSSLEGKKTLENGEAASCASSVVKVGAFGDDTNKMCSTESPKYSIARLPLCLGTVQGEVKHISIERAEFHEYTTHKVKVVTDETTKTWNLESL